MRLDDPRITAFALDELPASERAEIERFLQTERAASDEVARTKEFAGVLRNTLHAEPAEGLTSRHREAIFRAALAVNQKTDLERKIITHPALWQRAGFWQAAAACVICGFGAYAITSRLYGPAHSGQENSVAKNANEISVQIGQVGKDISDANAGEPDVTSPANATPAERHSLVAKIDAARTQRVATSNPATGDVPPKLQGVPALPATVASVPENTDPIAEIRRGASIGKKPASVNAAHTIVATQLASTKPAEPMTLPGDLGQVTLTSEEAATFSTTREYLQTRWQEASSLHAGDSYATLAQHFRHDGASTSGKSQHFVMIRCPLIKVDVEFTSEAPQKADTRIEKISRPYFEPEAAK